MTWTIPLSQSGSPCDFEKEIFPGVKGYAILENGEIWIPDIRCETPGQFRKFLRLLESYDPPIVIANVVNGKLRRVLHKRGWRMSLSVENGVDEWRFK